MRLITNNFAVAVVSLIITSCITVPPIDKIISFDSHLPKEPTIIQPHEPYVYIEQINQPQTLTNKLNYISTSLINYSWGRGWTDKTTFSD